MSAPVFERVALIGVGLIGGSIARAAREKGLVGEIYGYSRKAGTRDEIRELGICDRVFNTPGETVARADLVILCTPVQTYAAIAQEIAPFLKAGTVVSDVGSVKGSVVRDLEAGLPSGVHIIPGHPIAGTEHSGPGAGFADLFAGRWQILTPTPTASMIAVDRLSGFWEGMGSQVEIMTPDHHDMVLAMTSHLPHLVAYALVGTAVGMEDTLQSDIIKFSAGGFRDSTRIAASDPTMWRDIFLTNREAVLAVVDEFDATVKSLRRFVEQADGDAMFDTFSTTRTVRNAIIEAGQAGHFDPTERTSEHLSDDGFLSMYGD